MVFSLNPLRETGRNQSMGEYDYDHPVFDRAAIDAQAQVAQLQGHLYAQQYEGLIKKSRLRGNRK